jgi:protein phosphatase
MKLNTESLKELISKSIQVLKAQQSFLNVTGRLVYLPQEGYALVIGDLHGDLETLQAILRDTHFKETAAKNSSAYVVFLGDYIDRGPRQVEVIATVLNLLVNLPNQVVLLRGNHEGPDDLPVYPHDFPEVLATRYGQDSEALYALFKELFNYLYTAVVVERKALILHGGIPTNAQGLADIAYAHEKHPEESYLTEIIWNDPSTLNGVIRARSRGVGKKFGADIASQFLDAIGVQTLIRGHEQYPEGYYFNNSRVLTLFSCKLPLYRNSHGAYLYIPLNEQFDSLTLKRYIHQV